MIGTATRFSMFFSVAVATAFVASTPRMAHADEEAYENLWYVGGGLGLLAFEGDEEVDDGWSLKAFLGYDYSDAWSFEGFVNIAPELDGNNRNTVDGPVNRLKEKTGASSTWALSVGVDALYHLTRWERVDPYFALGVGLTYFGEDFGNQLDPAIRAGVGVFYHFNDVWAVRADARGLLAGSDTEANGIFSAGVVYTPGAAVGRDLVLTGGGTDSDADGLLDSEEGDYGTDPYDPDTDKDDLSDGDEVKIHKTNPLDPDTDLDRLKDGVEVYKYKTDPTDRDTDDGGVDDGHEVLDDNTNPLDPVDDLLLYELKVRFDTDQAVIKEMYKKDVDVVGKVLKRDPKATAVIEGHADKRKKSSAKYNKDLSQRRADAILKYLVDVWTISAGRLEAIGYGFDRPKAPNDPVTGNPENRRSEIYIRLSDASAEKVTN